MRGPPANARTTGFDVLLGWLPDRLTDINHVYAAFVSGLMISDEVSRQ
jgi:hypothetical protein